MRLTSEAFSDGDVIPREYTCDGEDRSPPLKWTGAPEKTKSFVLLVDDPDAPNGTFHHWACYDIPAHHAELVSDAGRPEGFEDFRHGMNDFRELGYRGPCPPRGHGRHRYRFRLLALNCAELPIRTHPTCVEVEEEARKHLVSEARLTGLCQR
ncbi:YbhB/YbcL family Raf kinase inhibitor-like protein [Methylocystis sp. JAN1]|uniref:YbhB/YbcL family Raf kinase inhibitor-like protein n=1 Tax=Methylocystis sp. JAN1 TaxID=3397211 RepID=UPI003FA33204